MSEFDTLKRIAAKLALEVRYYGRCRGKVHQPVRPDNTPVVCDCRHCESLRELDAFTSIVQLPGPKVAR